MTVRNYKDLRFAYSMARSFPIIATDDYKRGMRAYQNKPASENRLVKDYGIDGAIILYPLPDYIKDMETAVAYFEGQEYIDRPNSPYDCTGKPFTEWYKIVNKGGRFWAYHSIGMDV